MERTRTVYVGAGSWGSDAGMIQVFELDVESGRLELQQELATGGIASFMARSADGRTLYVADEGKGRVTSYRIAADGKLALSNSAPCAGHPVYVTLDRAQSVLVACYFEEGQTEVFALSGDGSIGASSCVVPSGRESHCAAFDPSCRFLFVTTRGAGWVAQYRFDAASRTLAPNEPARVIELPGSGPRHLTFHPNGRFAYLACELSRTLSGYAFNAESGQLRALFQGVEAALPGVSGGSAADVHVHPSGHFLYLSNRQEERSNLAIFAVDSHAGGVELIGHELTHGRTPRNFAFDPSGRLLIAGNQDSNDVAVFRIAEGGRKLAYLHSQPAASGPFFVGIY